MQTDQLTGAEPPAKRRRTQAPDPLADTLIDPLGAAPVTSTAPPSTLAPPVTSTPLRGDRNVAVPPSVLGKRTRDRETALEAMGVGSQASTSRVAKRKSGEGKSTWLAKHPRHAPQLSPAAMLGQVPPDALIPKVDPSQAGDHSPSISAVNKTTDGAIGVTGRSHQRRGRDVTLDENRIPTLQFTTAPFTGDDGQRRSDMGNAAHTAFTSLREVHGVGEREALSSTDDLLDGTLRAYSPYDASGAYSPGPVTLPRTNVFDKDKKTVLHESARGVDPFIGQAQMNIWYRQQRAAGIAAKKTSK
mgnify:CR=1 FL=1